MTLTEKEKSFLKMFKEDVCIVKNSDGQVLLSKYRPVLDETLGVWNKADFIELQHSYFKNLSWKRAYFAQELLVDAER